MNKEAMLLALEKIKNDQDLYNLGFECLGIKEERLWLWHNPKEDLFAIIADIGNANASFVGFDTKENGDNYLSTLK